MRLLPATIGNEYRGSRVALIFFVFMAVMTVARSLIHIVAPDGGAQSIATIPLDSFTANGAATVVHLFALALVEYATRLALTWIKPMEIAGTAPGGVGNYVLIPVLAVMLWLSLCRRAGRASAGSPSGA